MADRALFEQWRLRGDAESFRMLTERYSDMVYATGLRILRHAQDAEDVSQLAFEKLARMRTAPKGSVGAWLHRVATNQALDLLRAQSRRLARERSYAASEPARNDVAWDDIYLYVDEAIAELPRDVREAVVAHFLCNRTHDEIAREAGVSRAAVTQRIHRGVDRVRRALRRRGIAMTGAGLLALLEQNLAAAGTAPASLTATLGKIALSSHTAGTVAFGTSTTLVWFGVAAAVVVVSAAIGLAAFRSDAGPEVAGTPKTLVASPADAGRQDQANQNESENPVVRSDEDGETTAQPSIGGHVTDADTGEGVPGAVVSAVGKSDFTNRRFEVESGTDGIYTFSGLPSDTYSVVVKEARHHLSVTLLTDEEREVHHQLVEVSADITASNVDFSLPRGVDITGVVVDSEGKPVPGARALALAKNLSMDPIAAQANTGGAFTITGFPPTAQLAIWATAPGLACAPTGPLIVPKTGLLDVQITLQPEARISGRVVDTQGDPMPVRRVVTQGVNLVHDVRQEVESNADGTFQLTGLAPGGYFLSVLDDERQYPVINRDSAVPVGIGEHVHDVELVCERGSESIAGRVVNAKGEPVANAEIECGGARVKSDHEGKFIVENLAQDSYTLEVSRFPFTPATIEADAGDTDVVVRLESLGLLRGRATDARTGAPVTELLAEWFPVNYPWPFDQRFEAKPTENGRFEVTGPADQEGVIGIRAVGYRPHREPVVLKPGNNPEVQIQMAAQPDLRGTVVDASGKTVPNALLFMGPIPDIVEYMERKSVARTDEDGSFVISASAVLSDSLGAFHPDFAHERVTLSEPQLQGNAPIGVTLIEGGAIQGTVTVAGLPDKRIISNLFTSLADFTSLSELKGGAVDGAYRYDKLPEGPATIHFLLMLRQDPLYYRKYFEEITIVSGEVVEVSHDFLPGKGTVYGAVTGVLNHEIWVNCSVQTTTGREIVYAQDPSASGGYFLDNIPPGFVTLTISSHRDRGTVSRLFEFKIEDGASVINDVRFGHGVDVCGTVSGSEAKELQLIVGHHGPDLDVGLGESSVRRFMTTRVSVVDGRYCFPDVMPGPYTLVAIAWEGQPPEHKLRYGKSIPIEVEGDAAMNVSEPVPNP